MLSYDAEVQMQLEVFLCNYNYCVVIHHHTVINIAILCYIPTTPFYVISCRVQGVLFLK